jgi:hypothetical protein
MLSEKFIFVGQTMVSAPTLSNFGSLTIQILHKGSITERVVLGTALFVTGAVVAYKIIQLVSRIFGKSQSSVALPKVEPNQQAIQVFEENLRARFGLKPSAKPSHPLESLVFGEKRLTEEMEVPLAKALYLYQKLKTEIGDDRFVSVAESYLDVEKAIAQDTSSYNDECKKLDGQLQEVGLSLKNLTRSEEPLAVAQLKDQTPKEIHDLAELYQIIELHAPHILSRYKIEHEKEQVDKAALSPHSLLDSLIFGETVVTKEMETLLATALHVYQELKTEIGDDRFIFLAEIYLKENALLSSVKWKDNLILDVPSHYNDAFKKLDDQLKEVGLSLKNLTRSEEPFAEAVFKDQTTKKIHDVAELYQIVKLQGPHILSSLEIELKKKQVNEAKVQLHESRLNIVDKMLSTLRAVLIDDFVNSFGEKHKELYTLVDGKPESLRFILENVCWHALDRAFEAMENTFILSEKAEQKTRKIDLETQLAKVLKKEEKLEEAKACLIQILENPDNNEAMSGLVALLVVKEGDNSEVKTLQAPQLQLQEESVEKELGRLQRVQQFYHMISMVAAVADTGKEALLYKNGDSDKRAKITVRELPSSPPQEPNADGRITYAKHIEGFSAGIFQAGREVVEEIADKKWNESLQVLDEKLVAVSLTSEDCKKIVEQGWVAFKEREKLLPITGKQRWLMTQKMIVQKLANEAIKLQGKGLFQEVSKRVELFFKTVYGRLVTTFLVFDERTRQAQAGIKPADHIAEACFETVVQCHQALQKSGSGEPGTRENSVVKELENNGGMHRNALNKASADTVFLGQLIVQLLSVLQPEGLTEDIHKVLTTALTSPGEAESNLLQSVIQKYKESIHPTVEPWMKPVGDFLPHLLQFMIEKKSSHNFAGLLSDLLNPANINDLLIDFLKEDTSEITITAQESKKAKKKWYPDDETFVKKSLEKRLELDGKIKIAEQSFEQLKATPSDPLTQLAEELVALKTELARLDMELAPQLLRRLLIAHVPGFVISYVVQFVDDLFELMQYPRVLRHIVFNVLEKSIHTLARPLETNAEDLLYEPVDQAKDQSACNFFFSDTLKTSIGSKVVTLFSNMAAADNQWSYSMWFGQYAAKKVVPGKFLFNRIQSLVEGLIKKKYENNEAVNWSAGKLVVTINDRILEFAQDPSSKGMKAVVVPQLKKLVGLKEEVIALPNEKDPVLL